MVERSLQIILLAAGKGTRMKSDQPKVMHAIAGRSMLGHVLALAERAGASDVAVVIGPDMDNVRAEALAHMSRAQIYIQEQQRGTGDAVLAARGAIAAHDGDVLVLYGDTPLIELETLTKLRDALADDAQLAVLGFHAADPTGYGRLLSDPDGALIAIREHKDASAAEREISLCNSGVLAFRGEHLLSLLERIKNDNANGEYYLTDTVEVANGDGLRAVAITCPEEEVLGINSRTQLAQAEAIYQRRARQKAMDGGATLIAPETVWLSYDTVIGRDVVIEPNVFMAPGVTIADGALIRANCHLEGAQLGRGVKVGPFARLRPGTKLAAGAFIGNFVEVKNTTLGEGAKASHLSYLGDGVVGARANIGAGTIFCNYDGFNKARTTIGEGAFIGSNSALVAPVTIGKGAFVGSGSVISKDVSADALALSRAAQEEKPGWAAKFRTMMARRKQRASGG